MQCPEFLRRYQHVVAGDKFSLGAILQRGQPITPLDERE